MARHPTETLAEGNGLLAHIRFQHRVIRTERSIEPARRLIEVEHSGLEGVRRRSIYARLLFCAASCRRSDRYDRGFTPNVEDRQPFTGKVVHFQHLVDELMHVGSATAGGRAILRGILG